GVLFSGGPVTCVAGDCSVMLADLFSPSVASEVFSAGVRTQGRSSHPSDQRVPTKQFAEVGPVHGLLNSVSD
ncbi:hypothetical protein C0993_009763, partial [Termitomyces sp. T159_Od127]